MTHVTDSDDASGKRTPRAADGAHGDHVDGARHHSGKSPKLFRTHPDSTARRLTGKPSVQAKKALFPSGILARTVDAPEARPNTAGHTEHHPHRLTRTVMSRCLEDACTRTALPPGRSAAGASSPVPVP
ncbi:hypothetical protein SXIM_23810 [Streptomyces xiamenensis]|uniref:Uncharacterized protein n=1 Tax=Streptomyces xiamenensis TaxID=408015 RepID=A0A0F7FV76_9ACTN|nr:hypothetical protein SXIM_23810 [Streptomyces xiamenensis]